jgi:hypothetical protein
MAVSPRASAFLLYPAVAFLFAILWILTQPRDGYSASAPGQASSQQVTVVGCSHKGISWFLSGADLKEYKLTGNTSKLNEQAYVQISGTLVPSDDRVFPDGTINVARVKELSGPIAELIPAIGKPSTWRKYTDQAHGIAYSLPATFPRWTSDEQDHFETKFVDKENVVTLAKWEIPRDVWGTSNFVGGEFSLSANSKVPKAGYCFDQKYSELIHGIRHVHVQESSVPPEEFD